MTIFRYSLIVVLIFLILTSCSPYKMKAIRASRDNRYELAIEYSLHHLKSSPKDKSVLNILNNSARNYFQETKEKIARFEKLNDWKRVAAIAENSYQLLEQVTQIYGTEFPTKENLNYLKAKKDQSNFKQADEIYSSALEMYNNGDLEEALKKFQECEALMPHFKDSDEYILRIKKSMAKNIYQKGDQLQSMGDLEAALKQFESAAALLPDFLDVNQRISTIKQQLSFRYFERANQYFQAGDYKSAQQNIQKSLSFQQDNPQAQELSDKIKNKLTVRLAILPFSASRVDAKFARICTDELISRVFKRKGEFVELVDRENLQKILEEQALSQTGVIDEKKAVEVGKLSGVNTIAVGSVTLLSDKLTKPKRTKLTSFYEKTYRDVKGVQRKRKIPFTYTQYERRREIAMQLSYRLINVETGEVIFSDSKTERITDTALWISSPAKYLSYLSASDKEKLKAPQVPATSEILIQKAISSLTSKAAKSIIDKISPF